jgi:hypothetical protein
VEDCGNASKHADVMQPTAGAPIKDLIEAEPSKLAAYVPLPPAPLAKSIATTKEQAARNSPTADQSMHKALAFSKSSPQKPTSMMLSPGATTGAALGLQASTEAVEAEAAKSAAHAEPEVADALAAPKRDAAPTDAQVSRQ